MWKQSSREPPPVGSGGILFRFVFSVSFIFLGRAGGALRPGPGDPLFRREPWPRGRLLLDGVRLGFRLRLRCVNCGHCGYRFSFAPKGNHFFRVLTPSSLLARLTLSHVIKSLLWKEKSDCFCLFWGCVPHGGGSALRFTRTTPRRGWPCAQELAAGSVVSAGPWPQPAPTPVRSGGSLGAAPAPSVTPRAVRCPHLPAGLLLGGVGGFVLGSVCSVGICTGWRCPGADPTATVPGAQCLCLIPQPVTLVSIKTVFIALTSASCPCALVLARSGTRDPAGLAPLHPGRVGSA